MRVPDTERAALAAAAAREAGRYLRESRRSPLAEAVLPHDVKLEQDRRSEEMILCRISQAFPDDGWLSEESGERRSASGYVWVVDPLDGSVNYFQGIPHCCVSIACRGNSGPLLGVVYDFFRDELFAAEAGKGAFLNGSRIRVSATRNLSEAVMAFGLMKDPREIAAGLAVLSRLAAQVKKVRMMGSAALDLCYVASGRADLFVEFGLKPWDVAAGALILGEAGGILQEEETQGMRMSVASNGLIQPRWRGTTRRIRGEK